MKAIVKQLLDNETSAQSFRSSDGTEFYLLDFENVSNVSIDSTFSRFGVTTEEMLTDEQIEYVYNIVKYYWAAIVHSQLPLDYVAHSKREIVFYDSENINDPLFADSPYKSWATGKLEELGATLNELLKTGSKIRNDGVQMHPPMNIPHVEFIVDRVFENVTVSEEEIADSDSPLKSALNDPEIANILEKDTGELTMDEVFKLHSYAVELTQENLTLRSEKASSKDKLNSIKKIIIA